MSFLPVHRPACHQARPPRAHRLPAAAGPAGARAARRRLRRGLPRLAPSRRTGRQAVLARRRADAADSPPRPAGAGGAPRPRVRSRREEPQQVRQARPGRECAQEVSLTELRQEIELLEREAELALLQELAEESMRGEGRFAVIEGTAGIGKTRLLGELRARLSGEMRILSARGGELEGEFSFGVVRQLFEPLLLTAPPEGKQEVLSGAALLAAPLFESSGVALQEQETDASFAMLHGLYWLAANVGFNKPTMIALDRRHWTYTPALRWLAYLIRRLEGVPLFVVAAMRPPEQGREPELLTEILSDPAANAVRPGPLRIDSISALARRRFGDEEPEAGFCEA